MQEDLFNSKERTMFFDAVISWTSEVNRELTPLASSSEIIRAYRHIEEFSNKLFKNDDGTWCKKIKDDEKNILRSKIIWLRNRVIM